MSVESLPSEGSALLLPMLPMRDIVVFPHMTVPFFIGRGPSIVALEKALAADRKIFIVTQKDPLVENPKEEDLYRIGTIGQIMQIMRLHNGTIKALFDAQHRAQLVQPYLEQDYYSAEIKVLREAESSSSNLVALGKNVRKELQRYLKEVKQHTEGIEKLALNTEEAHKLADRIAPILSLPLAEKQELLEELNPGKRLEKVYETMLQEVEVRKVEQKLKERIQGQIGKTQKEYYLNEQAKAIQKELGQLEDGKAELEEYHEKLKNPYLSKEAIEIAEKEIKRLKMMPPMSAESNVVRSYLDWIFSMPWGIKSEDSFDLEHAEQILNEEHYGLEKIKERIIEYLAVAQKVGKIRGPIICLSGPPGVGKTSLARSVAKALNKNFVRISLGGVRDEAEIRGHRRTYVGAMPGKIVQSLKKAKSSNPLILLDEIDKIVSGQMGDPASALLEVLDPEQNHTFMDHYLEIEYDLSDVLFFCTANVLQNIPSALKDRMEVINLPGYTELEKLHISRRHLVPKQIEENGLGDQQVQFQNKSLELMIQKYTREAGVRNLERTIAKVCRKVATQIVQVSRDTGMTITPKRIREFLGVPKYKHLEAEKHNEIGTTVGLAWTQVGGEILMTEVSIMEGDGQLKLTGQLGDVMKESAHAALSYIRSNANSLGVYSSVFQKFDIHVHVPEGAVPKDGPSAGITMTTSLLSALTGIPVRKDVAMTGEMTLRGRILPIGGLKEKLIAARRGNINTVLIPAANEKDLADIPSEIKKSLEIKPVRLIEEVLQTALEKMPEAVVDPVEEKEKTSEAESTESSLAGKLFSPSQTETAYPTHS